MKQEDIFPGDVISKSRSILIISWKNRLKSNVLTVRFTNLYTRKQTNDKTTENDKQVRKWFYGITEMEYNRCKKQLINRAERHHLS